MRPRRRDLCLAAASAALLAAGCAGLPRPGEVPEPGESPGALRAATVRTVAPIVGRARGIVVDTDVDADDLVALAVLAGDPELEVLAVTVSGTGVVHCAAGVDIARRWLTLLDRGSVPVACGREEPGPGGRAFPADWRLRADTLHGFGLPVVPPPSAAPPPAAELLTRTAAGVPEPVTIVALGPWTNLADAVRTDPRLPGRVREVHATLGTIDVPGDVDAGDTQPADRVEWNAGADPDALAAILSTDVPVTLVPLDATNGVPLTAAMIEATAGVGAGTGADLVSQLYLRDPAFATSRQSLWDSLTAVLLSDERPATWADLRIVVATDGPAAGALSRSELGRPVRAAVGVDGARATELWLAALTRAKVRIGPDGALRP